MKVLHFGSYWQKENDIVYAMVRDLKKVSDAVDVDTHLYDRSSCDFVNKEGHVNWIKDSVLSYYLNSSKIEAVVVNAGGMSLTEEGILECKKRGIKTIGISLSDPDVYGINGKIYSNLYDYFYTNSVYSIEHQYVGNTNLNLLPFAASVDIHYPTSTNKKYDIVIVASVRKDRIDIVKKLTGSFNVGIYGDGWTKAGIQSNPNVNGKQLTEAINSGKIYISFAGTAAGFTNVKVGLFEAIACRMCVITKDFPEVYRYFEKDKEIVTYDSEKTLFDKIKRLIETPRLIDEIADSSYIRFIKEHQWKHRFQNVLSKIA